MLTSFDWAKHTISTYIEAGWYTAAEYPRYSKSCHELAR